VHDVVAEELIADWEGRESARVDSAVAKVRAPEVRSDVANARDASEHRALDATSGQNAQRASASDQTAESSEDQAPPDEAERAAAVSNLEQEMARLLGQITTKSDS